MFGTCSALGKVCLVYLQRSCCLCAGVVLGGVGTDMTVDTGGMAGGMAAMGTVAGMGSKLYAATFCMRFLVGWPREGFSPCMKTHF